MCKNVDRGKEEGPWEPQAESPQLMTCSYDRDDFPGTYAMIFAYWMLLVDCKT